MVVPLIEVEDLQKYFGAIRALDGMQLTGIPGRIHAVMGENGAGKSTLMNLLSGVYKPDHGTIRLHGQPVQFSHPRDAQQAGISTIFQEFSLLPNLSIVENLFLGREREDGRKVSRSEMVARTKAVLQKLKLDLDMDRHVGALGVGQQQMIEIAKGVLADASVFIFDEPSAALASHEVKTLHKLIRNLASDGKTVFYVSHRLSEVFEICDDITIMKDGRFIKRIDTEKTTPDAVIEGMVGRPLEELFEPRCEKIGPALLKAEALASEQAPVPCTLTVHEGEILGIAGLEGQGQQALMRLLAGFDQASSGTLSLEDKRLEKLSARRIMIEGIGFVPESRKDDGLFTALDIQANMESAVNAGRPLWAWASNLDAKVQDVMERLSVKAQSARTKVLKLSGGNQQKVVLGRWLVADAKVLLCEEPTRGVDVGAKREIYRQLRAFTNAGGGILITSRELPELIGLCDRIVVIREGAIVHEVQASLATEDSLLRAALAPTNGKEAA